MKATLPTAPRGATRVLSQAITEMGGLVPVREASPRERAAPLRRSRGIPIHVADAADLALPYRRLSEVAGPPVGWRFVLGVDDRRWLADLKAEAGAAPVLSQILGAPSASRLLQAWHLAEAAAAEGDRLRLLKLPSSGMEVLWLDGAGDRLVDLGFEREPEIAGVELIAASMRRPL